MVQAVRRIVDADQSVGARVLEVGCSLGRLSVRLATLPIELSAMDVSVNAVRRARARVCTDGLFAAKASAIAFLAGSSVEIPFATMSFDIVVAADGPYSWDLPTNDRRAALAELSRVLRTGGYLIVTEHSRPHRFDELVAEVRAAAVEVERVEYLYDRPWYQLESWTRMAQRLSVVQVIRRTVFLARFLRLVGRAFGPRASRHVCIVARKR